MAKATDNGFPSSIFWCGGAWGIAFSFGVYKAMHELWTSNEISNIKYIGGNSAGAMLAVCMRLGIPFNELESEFIKSIKIAEQNGVWGKVSKYHEAMMDNILSKDSLSYKKLSNNTHIGVTTFPFKFELISKFYSNNDLKNCLHASMHLPLYCSNINLIKNKSIRAIDGSFSSHYYKFDNKCLNISITSNYGEIHPNPKLTVQDRIQPTLNNYYKMRNMGYNMFIKWNKNKKYNKLKVKSPKMEFQAYIWLTIFWFLRIIEEILIYYNIVHL